ncbi:MAG: 2-oxo acid dehydrogenase subunit E2 [Desulfobacterales bacterium]|nr:2-oxo acid dehydrogenase subunit E2 [Desulfobacterales bacterium]
MSEVILMPKLAMSMKQGTLTEWCVAEGDQIENGQVVLVIETEKVSYELEAPASGFIHIIAQQDETIPVLETLAIIADSEEELAQIHSTSDAPVPAAAAPEEVTQEEEVTTVAVAEAASGVPGQGGDIKISPLARKIAAQHNLDITQIVGTGPGSRIKKRDVLAYMEQPVHVPSAPVAVSEAAPAGDTVDGKRVKEILPMSGFRQAMASHMAQSHVTSARVSVFIEIDMKELIQLRKGLVEKEEILGTRVSFTDLFVFLISRVLRDQPLLNSTYTDDGIVVWEDINIGIALSLAKGGMDTSLVVPVIKNADRKSLIEISKELKTFVSKGREGTLGPDEMSGGTFTFTNTAQLLKRWHIQTPMITQPESAILGTSSTVQKAVVKDGEIVARPMMPVQLSFDHRVMDGSQPTIFLDKFANLIEDPNLIWTF